MSCIIPLRTYGKYHISTPTWPIIYTPYFESNSWTPGKKQIREDMKTTECHRGWSQPIYKSELSLPLNSDGHDHFDVSVRMRRSFIKFKVRWIVNIHKILDVVGLYAKNVNLCEIFETANTQKYICFALLVMENSLENKCILFLVHYSALR